MISTIIVLGALCLALVALCYALDMRVSARKGRA
jgi:hypothetical protein